jgi:ferritin-like metal-binding protein YciE
MKKLESLDKLLVHELRDLYSAEKQLVKALPKMADGASSKALQRAFRDHLKVTEKQVKRLEMIFDELEVSSRGPKCAAMEGLIEEGSELLDVEAPDAVLDAALIGAAQRVEHYEIAGYGVARTFAHLLGHDRVAGLLDESLQEEGETDKLLTELAMSEINVDALESAEA